MIFDRFQLFIAAVAVLFAHASIDLASVEQEYVSYLRTFGKSLDRLYNPQRLERFLHNLQVLREHNTRQLESGKNVPAFSLKLNAMSDMLPDEVNQLFGYRNHKKNVSIDQQSLRKKKHISDSDENYYHSNLYPFFGKRKRSKAESKDAWLKNIEVPESINWSNDNNPIGSSVMSAVRNQGGCGACWAFVAVATAEAALRISLSGSVDTTQATLLMPGATEETHIVHTAGYPILQSTIDNGSASGVIEGGYGVTSRRSSGSTSTDTTIRSSLTPHTERSQNNFTSGQDTILLSTLLASPFPPSYHSQDQSSPPRLAWIPSLSVQELVDCDTSFNRGCSGGSPLYAFRFIASKGLVPWSRYEYKEQVDTCGVKKASILPVAKYFIRDYGKVPMLDSVALMAAVTKGPVALGVCGTDPHFMLYSTGVFDLDTCCTDQNHAITLVGYGHDEATGLDYWLAQNSWGKLWGESGYIKIKRTEIVGQPGICGMLANPMFGTGGYILDEKGHFIDPSTSPHYPRYITDMQHWMEDNWREMMVLLSGWLLCISLMILIYACYVERLMYLHAQLRATNNGYTTIDDHEVLL